MELTAGKFKIVFRAYSRSRPPAVALQPSCKMGVLSPGAHQTMEETVILSFCSVAYILQVTIVAIYSPL